MSEAPAVPAQPPSSRWLQLVFGVLCMVMIANLRATGKPAHRACGEAGVGTVTGQLR